MMEIQGTKLFSQDYEIGETVTFSLYREEQEGRCTTTLYYQFPGQEPVACKRFFYDTCAEDYKSPYLSWYNLICCSNNYGPIPVVDYMNHAVQNGKKIAATIYPNDAGEYMRIIGELSEDYYCYPYHPREYQYLLYISRKGTLKDYFDLDRICSVYESCKITLDREKMEDYFSKELSYFGNEEVCRIQLHDCIGREELAVTGLLFGYPVESTIALIRRDIDMCE